MYLPTPAQSQMLNRHLVWVSLQQKLGSEHWNCLYRDAPTINTMAKAPQGTTVPVEVFLNERYIPIRGWSSGHLLPTERHMFSHGDGTPDPGYEGQRHGTPNQEGLRLPLGWEWAGDWKSSIGDPSFDGEGMQYAFNWTSSSCEYLLYYGLRSVLAQCLYIIATFCI